VRSPAALRRPFSTLGRSPLRPSAGIAMAAIDALCMACNDETCDFKPMRFQRRPLGPEDVLIDLKFCGVCHSDLHTAANHMKDIGKGAEYPCVPGHELAGICVAVGEKVTKVKVGDQVGVGCLVDSCHDCAACKVGEEQKCAKRVGTYGGKDTTGRAASYPPGKMTMGGYASKMVVHERFAILIPPDYPLKFAGPVLCAGITMYDPLKRYGATKGTRVGVIGLGGLGVMGIKLAKALGCVVTAISRTKAKEHLATAAGAVNYVASADPASMTAGAGSLDLILNTIPAAHDWAAYQVLLAKGGKHVLLGVHSGLAAAIYAEKIRKLSFTSSTVVMSMIGGITNTQEVIDLCARDGIYPDIEVVLVQKLNEVYTALDASNDAGKRFVLDLEGSLNEETFNTCDAPPPKLAPNATGMTMPSILKELAKMVFLY